MTQINNRDQPNYIGMMLEKWTNAGPKGQPMLELVYIHDFKTTHVYSWAKKLQNIKLIIVLIANDWFGNKQEINK